MGIKNEKIPYTIIVDNAGGYLMQKKEVDLCIVGSDRTTSNGDVCNKIGTYLKALSAFDNNIPFYVAVPQSTIDFKIDDSRKIPIEVRSSKELSHLTFLKKKKFQLEKYILEIQISLILLLTLHLPDILQN